MVDVKQLKNHIYDVLGALQEVHHELGPGLTEFCYLEGLQCELEERKIPFEREKSFPLVYHGRPLEKTFRIDFLCKGDIVVECKSVSYLTPVHRAQLFNYLRLLKARCGVLVNFAPDFAVIERYFFDQETGRILTVDGRTIKIVQ